MKTSCSSLVSIAVALVTAALAAAFTGQRWRIRCKKLERRLEELEVALEVASQQRSAERIGRIRAQRELRKGLISKGSEIYGASAYPMTPIGYVRSCFSTRNGTPRQPLLVPLARACLTLSSSGVPSPALEGLDQYSHCWLLYVFHENTDLPNLWKQPAHQALKAKVRVPRLDGKKVGVFATRSPHRPCPIGLTVGKVEKVFGRQLLLSGVDLVDGTPVLDIKPYLPYSDSIIGAATPFWVEAGEDDVLTLASVSFSKQFSSDLAKCWETMGKHSLYSTSIELEKLVAQVLSRDIRSLNQRRRPHNAVLSTLTDSQTLEEGFLDAGESEISEDTDFAGQTVQEPFPKSGTDLPDQAENQDQESYNLVDVQDPVVYHLILEGINIAYTINDKGNVLVRSATISTHCNEKKLKNHDKHPAKSELP